MTTKSGTALVLTLSDTAAAGGREDLSGPEAARILTEAGFDVRPVEVLPDDRSAIEARLRSACAEGLSLVVTTGGTGLSPRDVTPDATLAAWVQGHWSVENRLHWFGMSVTPRTSPRFAPGRSPRVMATCRNVAISLLRIAGWDNIAAGLRHHAANPAQALALALT